MEEGHEIQQRAITSYFYNKNVRNIWQQSAMKRHKFLPILTLTLYYCTVLLNQCVSEERCQFVALCANEFTLIY